MTRSFPARLAAILVGALSLAPLPSLAQQAPAQVKPATNEELFLYSTMGALSTCNLAINEKVGLEKAIPANVSMIVSVIQGRHGSAIAGPGKLKDEQLASGTYVQMMARIKRLCYANMTAADKALVDKRIAEIEKAAKSRNK